MCSSDLVPLIGCVVGADELADADGFLPFLARKALPLCEFKHCDTSSFGRNGIKNKKTALWTAQTVGIEANFARALHGVNSPDPSAVRYILCECSIIILHI